MAETAPAAPRPSAATQAEPALFLFFAFQEALDGGDEPRLTSLLQTADAADAAKAIALLDAAARAKLVELAGEQMRAPLLVELEDAPRAEILTLLPPAHVGTALQELPSDDAVFVLEALPPEARRKYLRRLAAPERRTLQAALKFPENSAGRLMQADIVTARSFWTVGRLIDYFRKAKNLPQEFLEIYVVDAKNRPIGVVRVHEVLRRARSTKLSALMDKAPRLIPATMDREEVANRFRDYSLVAAAVVDKAERLVGVITADDVLDVVHEEAGEDILRLGGVGGDAALSVSVWQAAGGRLGWLLVNLATAILASWVISLFGATLQQMVALAILMPIVASMGGNAGTQTLTVAVRALATHNLVSVNALRVIWREAGIGLINGIGLALIAALVGWLWFASPGLGWLLLAAMLVNMLTAALAGILVPLGLQRAGVDPAIASVVLVTTVTDVVGFVVFLGLASLFLVG